MSYTSKTVLMICRYKQYVHSNTIIANLVNYRNQLQKLHQFKIFDLRKFLVYGRGPADFVLSN